MDRNNFDGMRIGLALVVVFAHVSALTQLPEFRILDRVFDSNFAVRGFFAISGFLVTRSHLASDGLLDYASKRIRRIYPAYLTTIGLCLCIGAYATRLGFEDFVRSPQTLRYVLANAAFLNFLQPTLPAVFDGNPVQAMNGSLWTIKVEVMLYLCVPPMVLLFRLVGPARAATLLFVLGVAWAGFFGLLQGGARGEELARQFPGQLPYFALGALLAVDERARAHCGPVALASLIALFATDAPAVRLLLDPIAYASIVLFLSTGAVRNLGLGRFGDLSYGIYLVHFPIIQLLVFLGLFQASAWAGLAASLALTLVAAFASWHLIERPMLRRRSHRVVAAPG